MTHRLIRDVTQAECSWLRRDYKEGEVVFAYPGCIYDCVSPAGMAFTEQWNKNPFFELPRDAVVVNTGSEIEEQS